MAPPHTEVNPPARPPVSVDDLRRSGKVAIWPYIMRELPLSPVEALLCELRSRERQGPSRDTEGISNLKGVEYFPARLTGNEDNRRAPEIEQDRNRLDVHRRQQDFLRTNSKSSCLFQKRRTGDNLAISWQPATSSTAVPSGQLAVTKGSDSGRLQHDRRPASSGGCHRPPRGPLARAVSTLWRCATGDHVECPLGCGEEVRICDLVQHQTSLCAFRYVNCLMSSCPTLVQARLLGLHLKRDCLERKKQRTLADKGKTLDVEIVCDACSEKLLRRHLRAHCANDCQMRMVQCSNPGCTDVVPARSLAEHQRVHCRTARRKAVLSEHVASKPIEEECPACHETVAASFIGRHAADECLMRSVACPNRNLGCGVELKAAQVSSHLREQCVVQSDRATRASRYRFRRQRVQCSGCGYMVILQHLDHHHRSKCPNRRVPCKHWELGCPAMLRLSTMNDHLKVDRLLDARSCLVFDSGRAYIALEEDDWKAPWTAELWIWRPALVESVREKARTALKALWEFQRARGKLAVTERRLALLEPFLVDVATQAAKERSADAELASDRLKDEMIAAATVRDNAKVDLVVSMIVLSNSLASARRGVEEITAQDRLRGFDQLALGSSPWYTVSLGAAKSKQRGEGVSRDEHEHGNPLVKALPESQVNSQRVRKSIEIAGEQKTSPETNDLDVALQLGMDPSQSADGGQLSRVFAVDKGTDSVLLESDDVATLGQGIASKGTGINTMLFNFAKEQDVLAEAEENKSRLKEAAFWAEWVALAGPSLARRILSMASETLPRLKEETAAITGLTTEALFCTPGDAGTEKEGSMPDEGGTVHDNAGATSAKESGKKKKAAKKAKRKQKHEKEFGKNLDSRIAEEVGKRGGVETLFGSDKALFQLEMGPDERVGIKIAGKKDQIFNYRCPRERWVHLAFVSDSTGVYLLENGKTASRLRDITVGLPMREIGGRETACQCLMQEVRYWKVKRSKEELVAWMHEVLPGTAVADGLLGYWTFEEGAGEYVNDVTEQRFRARKVGRGLKWGTSEIMYTAEVAAPPTPSWREKNVCKVELRRGRLAQRGRLHQQYMSCPSGCGESFLRKNARAHATYRCAMRMITCTAAACGKQMPAKDLPRHLKEFCASYGAWLRMAEAGKENQESCFCPHCAETVLRCNLKLHVKYRCQWAKEPCRNVGCAAFIPRIRRDEHERRFCGALVAVRRRRRLARARAKSKYTRDWAQDGQ